MRRRMMACTTSIGPGATNLVTAAALAHVNRLPVLFLPGDVFMSRAPDPGLAAGRGFPRRHACPPTTASSRCRAISIASCYPAQLLTALPRAIHVLTDAALCGPVTLALPQDVQTMAYDFPEDFFAPSPVLFRAQPPMEAELARAVAVLRESKRPLIVAGGGVLYAQAGDALRAFAEAHGVPVAETQAGKGALAVGSSAASGRDRRHRLAPPPMSSRARPTSCSRSERACRISPPARIRCATQARLVSLNVNAFDALKWRGVELRRRREARARSAVARAVRLAIRERLASDRQHRRRTIGARRWTASPGRREVELPYEGEVIGAVQRSARRLGRARHRRLRRGNAARRAAQALAHGDAGRLPHGIRLLVHGLRNRRRARRQDGASPSAKSSSWSATAAT